MYAELAQNLANVFSTSNEEEMPSFKTRKRGRYDAVRDMVVEDVEMADMANKPIAEPRTRRNAANKKDKQDKLAAKLKDSMPPSEVIDMALGKPITLSFGQLIGLSQSLHKAIFSSNPGPSAAKGTKGKGNVNFSMAREKEYNSEGKDVCISSALHADASINDKEISAMIDTGAEINIIPQKLARQLGLEINDGPRVFMVVPTEDEVAVVGCCEGVEIAFGPAIISTTLMVIESARAEIFLGSPFQKKARWGCTTNEHGVVRSWVIGEEWNKKVTFNSYQPDVDGERRFRSLGTSDDDDDTDVGNE